MKFNGKHLIQMGYHPGPWFKAALSHLNTQDRDWSTAEIRTYLDTVAPQLIDPHPQPLSFHCNITAETEDEQENVTAVLRTMESLMRTPTLIAGAVMPDACPTGKVGQIPVGGVAVARNAIHPAMHSADICCSVMMTSFGEVDPKQVLDAAYGITHFGPGGRAEFSELPKELEDHICSNSFLNNERSLTLATSHLGTQGDGNHFLYVGRSETTGETIMVTHHGSRGFGANLYKQGKKKAEAFRREYAPKCDPTNAWIPYDTETGHAYWKALQIVRDWTKLNHTTLHQAVCDQLDIAPVLRFWNEHNFVFKKDDLFYHAKGATPLSDAFVPDSHEGMRLIPLNMREPVLVVRGKATATNLGFAPHGAGRNTSRSQHRRKQEGRTKETIFAEETQGLDVRFFSGEIDVTELPSAYKNAAAVQAQMEQFGLGEVVDRIMPYGCIMAGDWQSNAPWRKKKKHRIAG